ncbi:MAG TPA: GtrA family protein [Bacteroidia bacterium]|nr:GtrA family protein [Bacteroidia bacterium]HNS11573.1 GtrA family protein [Bacteroidia bacterium]
MSDGSNFFNVEKPRSKSGLNISAFYTYLRSQLSALLATVTDFVVTIICKEGIGIWYVHSVAIGAAVGALTAFLLNRNWVFKVQDKSVKQQALRYVLVAGGSWLLNISGVYLLTESIGISYLYSKVVVSILIGLSFNFILAKRFVFV